MSLSLGKDGFVLEVLGDGREALHFHRALELMYVLEGTVEVTVNGQETKLCPQDVFLVNVNKPHELVAADDALYVRLTIGYEIVRDVFNDYDLLFICDSTEVDDPSYEGLRSLLKSLLAQYLSGHCHAESLMSLSLCYHIADYLCANYLFRSKDLDHDASTGKRDDRIKAIDGYIMSNFDQPISLKEAAGTLGLSVGYLSRVFKRHYGMTFNSYLTKVRLLHAVDDLLSTSEPITRVAHDNGFSSTTSFNKSFKEEYHETPSEMQRKASSKRERDVAADESRMESRLERYAYHDVPGDVASAGASLEEAAVDVTTTEPLRTPWSEVINVGSAEDLLSSEVQRHVAVLKEKVGFKYVRLWTPFSREMLLDLGRPGESFNFSRLDNVLDFLLKIGAKPFIDLSSKPRRILRGIDDPLVFDDSGISQDLETWEQVIDAFMRHLCHRYQPDEVEQWKFELWFDDNSFDDPACRSAYRKLFSSTYRIIKKHVPGVMLGGCGLHTSSSAADPSSTVALTFLREFSEERGSGGVFPDFISVYSYGYDAVLVDGRWLTRRDTSLDFLRLGLANMRRSLEALGLEDVPIYVTEWNITISDRNVLNDTCFDGAYIIKNYIDTYGMADAVAHFSATDLISESYDASDILFGGCGLLTKDGILKPAAYAFVFLHRLLSRYVGRGEHWLATTDGKDRFGIVCQNCMSLGYNYFSVEEDELDRGSLGRYFSEETPCHVTIRLQGMRSTSYKAKVYGISQQDGSILDMWQGMEYGTAISREDIQSLSNRCEPRLTVRSIEATQGELVLDVELAANEIAFVSLLPDD